MKIEVGKTYRTRDGYVVRITAGREATLRERSISADNAYSEFYEVGGEHPDMGFEGWRSDGRYYYKGECQHDLIEEVTLLPDAPGIYDEAIARAINDATAPAPTASIYKDVNGDAHAYRDENDIIAIDRDATRTAIHRLRSHSLRQWIAICLLALAVIIFGMRTANARDLLWMPNDAGGEIVLTDARIPRCGEARVVIARAAGGRALVGCWAYTDSGYVAARFGDDLRMWKLEDFRTFEPVQAPARRELRL